MTTIIPSNKIFSLQNEKVVNNRINSISVDETNVNKVEKELVNFSLSPFTEDNFKFQVLWGKIDYLFYNTSWEFDQENVSPNGIITINGIECKGFRFRIETENYIDLKSISVKLSMKYRRGESYAGNALSRPAFISNDNLQGVATANATISFADYSTTTRDAFVLSGYNTIPAAYARATLESYLKKSKLFFVTVFVPTAYNPKYTEQTGMIDSVVFQSFSISIIGKEYDFSSKSNVTYGSGEKSQKISSNEFFQLYETKVEGENYPLGTFFYGANGRVSASKNLCETIISHYQDGKETAVIRCSVPEDLSVFEIGDEVIPMVFGADGVDRPMSRYKDGTQKVFNVVGTKFIYDGAVWQELTLQEKTQSV